VMTSKSPISGKESSMACLRFYHTSADGTPVSRKF
jgi:hypothetical protein